MRVKGAENPENVYAVRALERGTFSMAERRRLR
jgi:hypothetical protein